MFAKYGFHAARYDHLGEENTPPIYRSPQIVETYTRRLLESRGQSATRSEVALAERAAIIASELNFLEHVDCFPRHWALMQTYAYPAIGEDVRGVQLRERAPLTKWHRDLTVSFRMGAAVYCAMTWEQRADQIPGEVRATATHAWSVSSAC